MKRYGMFAGLVLLAVIAPATSAWPQSPVNADQQTPPSIYGRRIHVGGAIAGSPEDDSLH